MSSDSTSPERGPTHPPSRRSPDVVPRHRTLDGVTAAVSQTDGIGLIDVDAFTTLVVRTDNSVYRITILEPHAREVLVQGGKFFPERTPACLSGSNFGGSCLKMSWVGLGLHMEFHAGDQWIITSHGRVHPHRGTGRSLRMRRFESRVRQVHRWAPQPCGCMGRAPTSGGPLRWDVNADAKESYATRMRTISVTDVVVAGLGDPALVCEHDRLGTVAETKLGEDARHVGFHGCRTDEELL